MRFRKVFSIFIWFIIAVNASEYDKCGETLFSTGTIINGKEIQRGEFPFLCAIYNIEKGRFFCGGTLITSKHVLSAAHCIREKDKMTTLDAEDIFVLLGRHNLKLPLERNSRQEQVSDIIVHPQWKRTTENYDADLSILVMNNQVDFSKLIRPACGVPRGDLVLENGTGTIVGWGVTEEKEASEEHPRMTNMRTFSNEFCLLDQPLTGSVASNRTFCAIGENAGPSHGDSGGGFLVKHGNLWTVQGIISASFFKDASTTDVSRYSLYTNLEKFYDWIKEEVERTSTSCVGEKSHLCSIQFAQKPNDNNLKCGKIAPGFRNRENNFPWMANLYKIRAKRFFCVGSIISSHRVLTVARCVGVIYFKNIVVHLGRNDLSAENEVDSKKFYPARIHIHPDFDFESKDRYDANIAILESDTAIEFSSQISPVCLASESDESETETGKIVSWEVSWDDDSGWVYGAFRQSEAKRISNNACLFKYRGSIIVDSISSTGRTFCAENVNEEVGPCRHNLGSGFLAQVNGDWFLHGMVSGVAHKSDGSCDFSKPVIYTKISSFKDWILQ